MQALLLGLQIAHGLLGAGGGGLGLLRRVGDGLFGLGVRVRNGLLGLLLGLGDGLVRDALRADQGFAHGALQVAEVAVLIVVRQLLLHGGLLRLRGGKLALQLLDLVAQRQALANHGAQLLRQFVEEIVHLLHVVAVRCLRGKLLLLNILHTDCHSAFSFSLKLMVSMEDRAARTATAQAVYLKMRTARRPLRVRPSNSRIFMRP